MKQIKSLSKVFEKINFKQKSNCTMYSLMTSFYTISESIFYNFNVKKVHVVKLCRIGKTALLSSHNFALQLYVLFSRQLNLVENWSSCSHSSAGEKAVLVPPPKGHRCWWFPHLLAYPLQVHLTLLEGMFSSAGIVAEGGHPGMPLTPGVASRPPLPPGNR